MCAGQIMQLPEMKRICVSLLLCISLVARAQNDSLLVMFWNVENFFDWHSGNGPKGWTAGRFRKKCDAICKTMLTVADKYGRLPDALGLAEVENDYVVKRIVQSDILSSQGYSYIHYESPDRRGIDCALLFRRHILRRLRSSAEQIVDSSGNTVHTRDILLGEFITGGGDTLAIMVNHHPSQIGGKTDGREYAMSKLVFLTDSLKRAGIRRILSVGDFNEDRWHDGCGGTIKFNGRWEKIDGHFDTGFSSVREYVFDSCLLSAPDNIFGGTKPLRTFSGPRYLGGISDHYPIVVILYF